MHTPVEVVSLDDVSNAVKLIAGDDNGDEAGDGFHAVEREAVEELFEMCSTPRGDLRRFLSAQLAGAGSSARRGGGIVAAEVVL